MPSLVESNNLLCFALEVVNLAALMFALSGLTMLVSAVGRNRWRALGVAALIAVGMFVANVVGQLWDGAAWVRPWTLFFYYQPQRVWLRGDWLAERRLGHGDPGRADQLDPLRQAADRQGERAGDERAAGVEDRHRHHGLAALLPDGCTSVIPN